MKKLVSIALCAALILAVLSGCGSAGEADATASPEASPETTGETVSLDWDGARAAYDLDTTVMTVDGSPVTWGEYFYWLYYCYTQYSGTFGAVADFSVPYIYDENSTVGGVIEEEAKNYAVQYHALEVNAAAEGISLTEDDEAAIAALLESDITELVGEDGTEDDLFAILEQNYVSRELYDYMNRMAALYSRAYADIYGSGGDKLTDEQVLDFANNYGYMSAKHILLLTTDEEGNAIDDAAKAEKLAQMEDIRAQLEGKTGEEL